MATWYAVRCLCLACHTRWGYRTKDRLREFTARRCPSCHARQGKVIFLGRESRDKHG